MRRPDESAVVDPFLSEILEEPKSYLIKGIQSLESAERRKRVEVLVRSVVADVLCLESPENIDSRKGFKEMGMTSLMSIEFSNTLRSALNVPFPASIAFDHPNVELLTSFLLRTVFGEESRAVENMQDAVISAHVDIKESGEAIAIVGLSCRFPGAANAEEFWKLLSGGQYGVSEYPRERWNIDDYYSPDSHESNKIVTRNIGTISDADKFDADFFGVSHHEARMMDPQQRVLLEVCWSALEDAGIDPKSLFDTETSAFVGCGGTEYDDILKAASELNGHYATGIANSILTGRISYLLGLTGPSMTIDTACSSSLSGDS